jgi:hypothetical protein
MKAETMTALALIAGSIVGALGSLVGTWIAQRHQDRRDFLQREITRREVLYSDFITEAARSLIAAVGHNLTEAEQLIAPYALLSRIRLTASPQVLAAAEAVTKGIVETYAKPNLTSEEIHAAAMGGEDPLREFSAVCRAELEGMRKRSLGWDNGAWGHRRAERGGPAGYRPSAEALSAGHPAKLGRG